MAIEFGNQEDLTLGTSRIQPRDVYVRPAVDPNAGGQMMQLAKALEGLSGTMEDLDAAQAKKEEENNAYYVAKATEGLKMGEVPDPTALSNVWSPRHYTTTVKYQQDVMDTQGRGLVQSLVETMPADIATNPYAFDTWSKEVKAKALATVGNHPFRSAYMNGVDAQLSVLGSQANQMFTAKAFGAAKASFDNKLSDAATGVYSADMSPKPELAKAIYASAQRLKMDPAVWGAIISYETGGTFDPWVEGPQTKYGKPVGLIQMLPENAAKYGYAKGANVDQLLSSAETYLRANGYKEGMSIEDVYSIINTGKPGNYNATDAANGGAPGTVLDKVKEIKGDHYKNALKLFGLKDPKDITFGNGAAPTVGPDSSSGAFGVTDMDGNRNPANFAAVNPEVQAKTNSLASMFGSDLRITPHGGTQPDKRKSSSQHKDGMATDIYIDDYTDEDKSRLVALAIANGATGLGAYSAGDGVGTIHVDYRPGKGNGPGGLALWHRLKPGEDSPYTTGPKWFVDGVEQGLKMRSGEVQVADASNAVYGASPNPVDYNTSGSNDENLPFDVVQYRNALFYNDQAIKYASTGGVGKQEVKSWALDHVIQTAIQTGDTKWFKAFPPQFVDQEVRDKFAETEAIIAKNNDAKVSAYNTAKTKAQTQAVEDRETEILDRLAKGENIDAYEASILPDSPDGYWKPGTRDPKLFDLVIKARDADARVRPEDSQGVSTLLQTELQSAADGGTYNILVEKDDALQGIIAEGREPSDAEIIAAVRRRDDMTSKDKTDLIKMVPDLRAGAALLTNPNVKSYYSDNVGNVITDELKLLPQSSQWREGGNLSFVQKNANGVYNSTLKSLNLASIQEGKGPLRGERLLDAQDKAADRALKYWERVKTLITSNTSNGATPIPKTLEEATAPPPAPASTPLTPGKKKVMVNGKEVEIEVIPNSP